MARVSESHDAVHHQIRRGRLIFSATLKDNSELAHARVSGGNLQLDAWGWRVGNAAAGMCYCYCPCHVFVCPWHVSVILPCPRDVTEHTWQVHGNAHQHMTMPWQLHGTLRPYDRHSKSTHNGSAMPRHPPLSVVVRCSSNELTARAPTHSAHTATRCHGLVMAWCPRARPWQWYGNSVPC